MPLNPRLPKPPFLITDLPMTVEGLREFLTLTGEIGDDYWNDEHIFDAASAHEIYFAIPDDWDSDYFRYHHDYYPSDSEHMYEYTATQIMQMCKPTLYKRGTPHETQEPSTSN